MVLKLLSLALCLLGIFPQQLCQCAPPSGPRAADKGSVPTRGKTGCCRECRCHEHGAPAPAERHDRPPHDGNDRCPNAVLKAAWQTAPPSESGPPASENGPALGGIDVADDVIAGRPLQAVAVNASPPHVPLYLSLLTLRN